MVQAVAIIILKERLVNLVATTQDTPLIDPAADGVVRR